MPKPQAISLKQLEQKRQLQRRRAWLVAVILLVLLIIVLLSIRKYKAQTPNVHPKIPAEVNNKAENVEYDFYKVLPKMDVKTSSPANFVLQVATVQQFPEATQLRRRLMDLGYRVLVQEISSDQHKKSYRVIVGPYEFESQARLDQQKLKKQHVDAAIIKLGSSLKN